MIVTISEHNVLICIAITLLTIQSSFGKKKGTFNDPESETDRKFVIYILRNTYDKNFWFKKYNESNYVKDLTMFFGTSLFANKKHKVMNSIQYYNGLRVRKEYKNWIWSILPLSDTTIKSCKEYANNILIYLYKPTCNSDDSKWCNDLLNVNPLKEEAIESYQLRIINKGLIPAHKDNFKEIYGYNLENNNDGSNDVESSTSRNYNNY